MQMREEMNLKQVTAETVASQQPRPNLGSTFFFVSTDTYDPLSAMQNVLFHDEKSGRCDAASIFHNAKFPFACENHECGSSSYAAMGLAGSVTASVEPLHVSTNRL